MEMEIWKYLFPMGKHAEFSSYCNTIETCEQIRNTLAMTCLFDLSTTENGKGELTTSNFAIAKPQKHLGKV